MKPSIEPHADIYYNRHNVKRAKDSCMSHTFTDDDHLITELEDRLDQITLLGIIDISDLRFSKTHKSLYYTYLTLIARQYPDREVNVRLIIPHLFDSVFISSVDNMGISDPGAQHEDLITSIQETLAEDEGLNEKAQETLDEYIAKYNAAESDNLADDQRDYARDMKLNPLRRISQ